MLVLDLAVKSLRNRAFSTSLTVGSIALSVALLIGVENVRVGVRESFSNTISQTDLVVGARGGTTQLLLYSVFGMGSPTQNISWDTYQQWAEHPAIEWTIPYGLGDSHRGYRVIGTSEDFLRHYRYRGGRSISVAEGRFNSGLYDVTLGADVAAELEYAIGDEVEVTHGLDGFMDHDHMPFTVVGVLDKTFTPVDRALYITMEGLEAVHFGWEDGAPPGSAMPGGAEAEDDHAHEEDDHAHAEEDEHDHAEEDEAAHAEDDHAHAEDEDHDHAEEDEDDHAHEAEDDHAHAEEDEHDHAEEDEAAHAEDEHAHAEDEDAHAEDEEGAHAHAHDPDLTVDDVEVTQLAAFFVGTSDRRDALGLQREINEFEDEPMSAVLPRSRPQRDVAGPGLRRDRPAPGDDLRGAGGSARHAGGALHVAQRAPPRDGDPACSRRGAEPDRRAAGARIGGAGDRGRDRRHGPRVRPALGGAAGRRGAGGPLRADHPARSGGVGLPGVGRGRRLPDRLRARPQGVPDHAPRRAGRKGVMNGGPFVASGSLTGSAYGPMAATRAIVGVVLAALAAGCAGDAGDDPDGAIKVGAIFDLTGPTADVGTDYADGMRGFVDWMNAQGGIEGRPIELIYQDYAYQVSRAEQLYRQFVTEGAVVFMGWGTGDTEALRPYVSEDQVPFSSASLSHILGDPAEAPYNFLVATSYTDQFRIALDWISRNHGEGTPVVALLHNASPFGLSPSRHGGVEFAEERGIELGLYEMPRGAVDFTGEFARIRQSGAQYVVFQNTSGPAAVALQNARSLGIDATFICLNWCSNAQLVQLAGEAAEGVMGTMPYAPLSVDVPGTRVIRDYLEARGESIEGRTNAYTQAWWTFAVFANAMRQVLALGQELTGANIKAALEGFTELDMGGVTVPITFTPDDHLGAKGLRIFRVEDGEWTPLTEFLEAPPRR